MILAILILVIIIYLVGTRMKLTYDKISKFNGVIEVIISVTHRKILCKDHFSYIYKNGVTVTIHKLRRFTIFCILYGYCLCIRKKKLFGLPLQLMPRTGSIIIGRTLNHQVSALRCGLYQFEPLFGWGSHHYILINNFIHLSYFKQETSYGLRKSHIKFNLFNCQWEIRITSYLINDLNGKQRDRSISASVL